MNFSHIQTNEHAAAAVRKLDQYVYTEPRKHLTLAWALSDYFAESRFTPDHRFFVLLQVAHSSTLLGEIQIVRELLYQDLPRLVSTTELRRQQGLYDAWIDTYRATFLTLTGDYREVQSILTNTQRVFETLNDMRGIAITEANLAIITGINQDYATSLQHLQRVREAFAQLPEDAAVGSRIVTLIFEVSALINAGRPEEAEQVLDNAALLAEEHDLVMPHISAAFAQLAMANGDLAAAERWYSETIDSIDGLELGENFVTLFYARYALFSMHVGQGARARDLIDVVIRELPADGERYEPNATALRIAAEIYAGMNDWEQAFEHYQRFIKTDLRQRKSNLHHDYRLRTAAKELEFLEFQANHDPLTHLLNRHGFFQATEDMRAGLAWGMLMIDTDHFKRVNDTHGHVAGDRVLRHLGRLLAAETPPGTVAARIGGEEFAVFVPGTPRDLEAVAEAVLDAVRSEVWEHIISGVTITVSIGGAHASNGAHDVLARADDQMYKAKRAGRDQYRGEQ